jgi:ADP-dependent phosphofructokinase/glucokinase
MHKIEILIKDSTVERLTKILEYLVGFFSSVGLQVEGAAVLPVENTEEVTEEFIRKNNPNALRNTLAEE